MSRREQDINLINNEDACSMGLCLLKYLNQRTFTFAEVYLLVLLEISSTGPYWACSYTMLLCARLEGKDIILCLNRFGAWRVTVGRRERAATLLARKVLPLPEGPTIRAVWGPATTALPIAPPQSKKDLALRKGLVLF